MKRLSYRQKVERRMGIALILPAIIIFTSLMVYPMCKNIWLSFHSRHTITQTTHFVGLGNYSELLRSEDFYVSLKNTLIFTGGTMSLQVLLGIAISLLLNESFKGRNLLRGLVLFPYLLPIVVMAITFKYMLNGMYGIINHFLISAGFMKQGISWLGDSQFAMVGVILAATWKYFPFVVICVLARLQTIPVILYEAARIDGAGAWARFWHITLPGIRGVLIIVIMLRSIWTFNNFNLIWLLTQGGPLNRTQTLPILAYVSAFGVLRMGLAAAVTMMMFAVLVTLLSGYFRIYSSVEQG